MRKGSHAAWRVWNTHEFEQFDDTLLSRLAIHVHMCRERFTDLIADSKTRVKR